MRLRDRVEEQNVQKGIAPMSGVALEHLRGQTLRRDVKRKHDLQWLRRWRKRWKVTLGTFPGREIVDAAEAQRKATYVYVFIPRRRNCFRIQIAASIRVPIGGRGSAFGASGGPLLRAHMGTRILPKSGSPAAPKVDPRPPMGAKIASIFWTPKWSRLYIL